MQVRGVVGGRRIEATRGDRRDATPFIVFDIFEIGQDFTLSATIWRKSAQGSRMMMDE